MRITGTWSPYSARSSESLSTSTVSHGTASSPQIRATSASATSHRWQPCLETTVTTSGNATPQRRPPELAGRRVRQLVDEPHGPRHLEPREAFRAVVADLVLGQLRAVPQQDDGDHVLAGALVGHADRRALRDLRQLLEDPLDLVGVHVEAVHDDQVVRAVD